MKKIAVSLIGFSPILLFAAHIVLAAEQKTVFSTERIEYKSGTGSERCQDKCNKKSGPDVTSLLAKGWNIVSSSPKKVIGENYRYVPCSSCEPHGCTCFGTEYILQRERPVPKAEITVDELDLLTKENQLLKLEIKGLKQENENLRNQMKSK